MDRRRAGDARNANSPVPNLLARIRSHDAQAASEIVRRYEACLRRHAGQRLRGSAIVRLIDPEDLSQEGFCRFFTQAVEGDFHAGTDRDLLNLLLTLVDRCLSEYLRKHHAACRDVHRVVAQPVETVEVPDGRGEWGGPADGIEQLQSALDEMDPGERALLLARASGRSWRELALQFQFDSEKLRSRHRRALARLKQKLNRPAE